MVRFDVNKVDFKLIAKIARRAARDAAAAGIRYTELDAQMDLTACHANGCPLRLADLVDAEDFDFGHDVFGIRHHLDRKTGKLGGCFDPRYAQRKESAA